MKMYDDKQLYANVEDLVVWTDENQITLFSFSSILMENTLSSGIDATKLR